MTSFDKLSVSFCLMVCNHLSTLFFLFEESAIQIIMPAQLDCVNCFKWGGSMNSMFWIIKLKSVNCMILNHMMRHLLQSFFLHFSCQSFNLRLLHILESIGNIVGCFSRTITVTTKTRNIVGAIHELANKLVLPFSISNKKRYWHLQTA